MNIFNTEINRPICKTNIFSLQGNSYRDRNKKENNRTDQEFHLPRIRDPNAYEYKQLTTANKRLEFQLYPYTSQRPNNMQLKRTVYRNYLVNLKYFSQTWILRECDSCLRKLYRWHFWTWHFRWKQRERQEIQCGINLILLHEYKGNDRNKIISSILCNLFFISQLEKTIRTIVKNIRTEKFKPKMGLHRTDIVRCISNDLSTIFRAVTCFRAFWVLTA